MSTNAKCGSIALSAAMLGLDPGIHPFRKTMDCRVKSGNDARRSRVNRSTNGVT
jgi:hypothetical protein